MVRFVSLDQYSDDFHQRRQGMALVFADLVNEPIEYGNQEELLGFTVRHKHCARQLAPVRRGAREVRIAQAHVLHDSFSWWAIATLGSWAVSA